MKVKLVFVTRLSLRDTNFLELCLARYRTSRNSSKPNFAAKPLISINIAANEFSKVPYLLKFRKYFKCAFAMTTEGVVITFSLSITHLDNRRSMNRKMSAAFIYISASLSLLFY